MVYEDSASGRTSIDITTEMTPPAWILVLISKHRRDIDSGAGLIATVKQCFTVGSPRFIRWLRTHINHHACRDQAVERPPPADDMC